MPHDFTGWFHTLAAVIALVTGTLILWRAKGTVRHKRTGRVYAVAMVIVCLTSFLIYRMHGRFGVLHGFAVVSTLTLFLGMLPLYAPGRFRQPMLHHLSWMYWSVIGLYCAFAAEIFTRAPALLQLDYSPGLFYGLVGASAGLVGMIGSRYFRRHKAEWEARFAGAGG